MNAYIHVPFCRKKCAYCAFYSLPAADRDMVERYLNKITAELRDCPHRFSTVYLGGGTPTLLEERDLERIFSILRTEPGAEISIEANPETLTPAKLAMLANYANRLSIGVQSFSEEKRRKLGRDCSDKAIRAALDCTAFPHRNLDLMYAVPGDTADAFRQDLRLAITSGVDHISCYSLTPEEQTAFAGTVIDEDASADLWKLAGDTLGEAGIFRYEVSNYARPGAECRHNVNVWRGEKLLGFGPAAASFDGEQRYSQIASIPRWLAGDPPEWDRIPADARRREIFAVNLRTVAGWQKKEFLSLPGATETEWQNFLQILQTFPPSFTALAPEQIRLTESGLLFWDDIASELL